MEKLKFFLLLTFAILFSYCNSDTNKTTEAAENFELQVVEEPEEQIKPFEVASIMPYFKDGKWGYANKQGEIVIPCKYDACGFFSEGLAWVEKDWKFGYIDTTGHLFIPHQYLSAGNFKNGVAVVQSNKYKGIIDKTNKLLIPFEYEELIPSENGLVAFKQNQQWGLITLDNKQILNPIYDNAFTFENGFAVVNRNRKQGIIDRTGKEVVICKFEEVKPTRGNYFIVMNEHDNKKKYGVADSTGKIIISISQKKIGEAINNSFVVSNEGSSIVVNNKLDTLVNFGFNEIRAGNTNLLAAHMSKGWGFINLKGDTIIPFEFWDAQGFYGNYAITKKSGGYGVINSLGENIVPFEFEEIVYADKDIFKVYNKDRNYGFYNTRGEKLTDCIYDQIDYSIDANERFMKNQDYNTKSDFGIFYNNYAIVGINGRFGAIDKKGKEVVKLFYHHLKPFDENGLTTGSYNDVEAIVNAKGQQLTGLKYEFINKDMASGYYYANYRNPNDGRDWKYKNVGYFNLDGSFFSNSANGIKAFQTEDDIILEIRKEYQRITALIAKDIGRSIKIDEFTTASLKGEQLTVSNSKDKITYEYYFSKAINKEGPFFILKTDKSSGSAKYDRYYYKNGRIIRWVDQAGKQQIVANAEYAPEHEELFRARFFEAEYYNTLLLRNNPRNKEVDQIDRIVAQIELDVPAGKYKKGNVYESWEGDGGGGNEEYIDNQGRFIYKYSHSGSDYGSDYSKEYYKAGSLVFSEGYHHSTNFYNVGFMGVDMSESKTKTYYFKDGGSRVYKDVTYHGGNIVTISEY